MTLGCKVNQYETQYVKETLQLNGWREAAEHEPADLCLVNTCTVTMEGDAKSRQAVRRLHLRNPAAAIVVMGCYATRDPAVVALCSERYMGRPYSVDELLAYPRGSLGYELGVAMKAQGYDPHFYRDFYGDGPLSFATDEEYLRLKILTCMLPKIKE